MRHGTRVSLVPPFAVTCSVASCCVRATHCPRMAQMSLRSFGGMGIQYCHGQKALSASIDACICASIRLSPGISRSTHRTGLDLDCACIGVHANLADVVYLILYAMISRAADFIDLPERVRNLTSLGLSFPAIWSCCCDWSLRYAAPLPIARCNWRMECPMWDRRVCTS